MSDERVWLRHEKTRHFWECPAGAVDDMADLGWQPTDERPVETNPVTAENEAWQAEQRAAAEAATAKPSRKSITAPGESAPSQGG